MIIFVSWLVIVLYLIAMTSIKLYASFQTNILTNYSKNMELLIEENNKILQFKKYKDIKLLIIENVILQVFDKITWFSVCFLVNFSFRDIENVLLQFIISSILFIVIEALILKLFFSYLKKYLQIKKDILNSKIELTNKDEINSFLSDIIVIHTITKKNLNIFLKEIVKWKNYFL